MDQNQEKVCTKCKASKLLCEFPSRPGYRFGVYCYCRACSKTLRSISLINNREKEVARTREWRKKNPGKVRESNLKYKEANRDFVLNIHWKKNLSRYGLNPEKFQQMEASQNFGCAICGDRNMSGRRLGVDHDHLTGQIRGLLCNPCNSGIGWFKDNPDKLIKAAEYLKKHQAVLA